MLVDKENQIQSLLQQINELKKSQNMNLNDKDDLIKTLKEEILNLKIKINELSEYKSKCIELMKDNEN